MHEREREGRIEKESSLITLNCDTKPMATATAIVQHEAGAPKNNTHTREAAAAAASSDRFSIKETIASCDEENSQNRKI